MADIFEYTVDPDDELTVTVNLGNGTTKTFAVRPGSTLLFDRDEIEGWTLEQMTVRAAVG